MNRISYNDSTNFYRKRCFVNFERWTVDDVHEFLVSSVVSRFQLCSWQIDNDYPIYFISKTWTTNQNAWTLKCFKNNNHQRRRLEMIQISYEPIPVEFINQDKRMKFAIHFFNFILRTNEHRQPRRG